MHRREFLGLLGSAAAGWPLAAFAQKLRTIGILMNGTAGESLPQANVTAFVDGMRALGWVDGRNLHIEYRWNGGSAERARLLAQELAKLAPDAILAASTTNLAALRGSTSSIPVVFLQVSDPIAQGYVTSLTHPGGNITGFSSFEFSIGGKWIELLKEVAPKLTRVAVMSNPATSPQTAFFLRAIETAAPAFNIEIVAAPVSSDADITRVIGDLSGTQPGGLILPTDTYTRLRQGRIAGLAKEARVPTLSAVGDFIDEGGLLFYGATTAEGLAVQFRQAASYVDRILKGAKPGDLPVQSPAKFELAINRKTATALGLEVPPKLLFTADRVIE
jgi:putative ABC transport system substrate-binding protein